MTRRRLAPEERRAGIVAAATRVFAERGYREASMGEIARAAGITPAVIYDHFRSKADLQISLLEDVTDRLLAHVGAAVAEAPEAPAERMRSGVDSFFRFFEDDADTWRLLFRDPPSDPRILGVYQGIHERATGGIAAFLKANAPPELFDAPDAHIRAEMLAQMLKTAQNGLADWWYDHREMPRERIVDAVLDFCWLGLERVVEGERSGYHEDMATQKQRQAARKNVKKAQTGARQKKTITKLSSKTRSALGREGAKAAARKRGASRGTGSGAGAMTVTELRREAAKLGIDGRSKMGKAQLVRAVGQKRRSRRS